MQKTENTSDLNSEVSAGEGKKKRKIKQRQFSSSSSEDEECSSLPMPPVLKAKARDEIDEEITQTYDITDEMIEKIIISQEPFQYSPVLRELNHKKETSKTAGKQVVVEQNNNCFVNPEKENNSLLTNSMECTCQLCPAHAQMQNKNAMYFKQIIRQQNYFKAQLWQTFKEIQDIKNAGLNQAANNNIQRQESVFHSFMLPFETEQQLEEVEQFLKNKDNFKTSVAQASRIGGKHSYEFIKRNLSKLLSNKLAEGYSWLGKKHKKKFYELKLAEMLIAAGEAYNETFTKKDLEEAIKKWLRRAKERSDAAEKKIANQERVEIEHS
ncbi:uncharacterized protein LOC105840320 [Monomorium pharaonis]|uniref:uncharacterized protein LOC105840320 n=1 Tax=Monomorium pharaonis TaxID=307658 RepID=UPI00063F3478|nr:uncharacterized protein LOC105840320 [Monomorium pharaonis]XP_036146908.1 uncharacterized protein LOC105840320 [Monomorium pharaonis]XP_036146909.1 uncharacterized protein LOC105840320 [Monomorium pharaonis]XP_036146910.1 uncharacterized protein LOC105840320 [Monomorium pharaonis]